MKKCLILFIVLTMFGCAGLQKKPTLSDLAEDTQGTLTYTTDEIETLLGYVNGSTAYGRSMWSLANEAAFKSLMNLEIGTDVQAYDADLTTYAGITPSVNVQSLLGAATYAAMKALLDLEIGTDVQAYDADLTTWAGVTPSANGQSLVAAATYAAMKALLDLEAGTDFYSISAADTAFLEATQLDDTKGNGDTAYIWSADKVYDQLALKLNVANPTFTGNLTVGSAELSETELEILDGATLNTTDINIIDGIGDSGTLTAAELLYVDGVTSAIQTQLDARCLESVFGTALEADDLELSGTTLQLAAEIPHTDVAETVTGNWELPWLNLDKKASAPFSTGDSSRDGYWWYANGTDWDPSGPSLGYGYFGIHYWDGDSEEYVMNFDERGTLHVSTFTTVETEFIPVGWMIDGASAPDASATVTSGTEKVDARTFAGDADEDLVFYWKVPLDLDTTSGIKFAVNCIVTSATAPSAETWQFELQGCSLGTGDALDCTLGTAQTSNSGERSDARYDLVDTAYSAAMTSTHITDLAVGENVVFKLYRDVDDTDTYAQNVGVIGVTLKYKRQHNATF